MLARPKILYGGKRRMLKTSGSTSSTMDSIFAPEAKRVKLAPLPARERSPNLPPRERSPTPPPTREISPVEADPYLGLNQEDVVQSPPASRRKAPKSNARNGTSVAKSIAPIVIKQQSPPIIKQSIKPSPIKQHAQPARVRVRTKPVLIKYQVKAPPKPVEIVEQPQVVKQTAKSPSIAAEKQPPVIIKPPVKYLPKAIPIKQQAPIIKSFVAKPTILYRDSVGRTVSRSNSKINSGELFKLSSFLNLIL
jgi:hypothetical protein